MASKSSDLDTKLELVGGQSILGTSISSLIVELREAVLCLQLTGIELRRIDLTIPTRLLEKLHTTIICSFKT